MLSYSVHNNQRGHLIIESLLSILLLGYLILEVDQFISHTLRQQVEVKSSYYINRLTTLFSSSKFSSYLTERTLNTRNIQEAKCNDISNFDLDLTLTNCRVLLLSPRGNKTQWIVSNITN